MAQRPQVGIVVVVSDLRRVPRQGLVVVVCGGFGKGSVAEIVAVVAWGPHQARRVQRYDGDHEKHGG